MKSTSANFIGFLCITLCLGSFAKAASEDTATNTASASVPAAEKTVASLVTDDLKGYDDQPEAVKHLISEGLALTRLNLSYKYGSSDPKNGGMDCSGTVYYLLKEAGLKDVPRDASEMYTWVWKESRFQAVNSRNADTFELNRLKPGDLLFWTGTYQIDRDPPITHVMIYLGTNRQTGHRVMLGASEGRPYDGKSRYGVSVFDFKIPSAKSSSSKFPLKDTGEPALESRFIGYGSVPGLNDIESSESSKKSITDP